MEKERQTNKKVNDNKSDDDDCKPCYFFVCFLDGTSGNYLDICLGVFWKKVLVEIRGEPRVFMGFC
jgi:hypothetical protein